MRTTSTALVTSLAASRDGVVAHGDLIGLGLDPGRPSAEVRAGRWMELAPGVYLTTPGPPALRQCCYAAVLHGGPRALITGLAGCVLRGVRIDLPESTPVVVVVRHGARRVDSNHCEILRSRAEVRGQLIAQGPGLLPLPVAVLERCVTDAIRSCAEVGRARWVATSCLRDTRLDWSIVAAAAARPGPGAGHLGRVARDIADGVRSPAEGDLHDALAPAARRGRLPPYLLNPDVYLDGVLLGSPDGWFPGFGLGHEQDSREWHGSVDQLDATLVRHERWRGSGLLLDHVTPSRFVRETAACLAHLADLVAERGRLAVPEPPGLVVLGRGPLLPARTPWPQITGRRAA